MDNNLEREYTKLEEKLGFYFGRLISYPLVPPEHVYFSLTTRCNLRCQMCDIFKSPTKIEDELSTPEIKDIILQIKNMRVRHLIFSGGEPLLRRDFFEIVEFATTNSIRDVDIITNGTLFDDYIIKKLLNLRLNHITISLDGLRETNDKIRGKGVFEKVVSNIDKLKHYKSKYGFSFPTLGINFTILDDNIDDLLPMIEFARGSGLNAILLQPVLFSNIKMYEKKRNVLWPSENSIFKLKKTTKKIISLKNTLKDFVICTDTDILKALSGYFMGKRPKINFGCYEAIKRIAINSEGKLWSCMGVYGDLKKKSLKENWCSSEAEKIRNEVKKCSEHCLQDCVYSSSDILYHVEKVLERLDRKVGLRNKEIEEKLLERVKHYIDILNEKYAYQRPLTNIRFKRELKKLYLIRDRLKKNQQN
ncbi:MAG: radical SAM protein [Candidatus Omnitrophica bacterium]|nr:radical SAM protein [Candidatus Omnitrophota bacterium]